MSELENTQNHSLFLLFLSGLFTLETSPHLKKKNSDMVYSTWKCTYPPRSSVFCNKLVVCDFVWSKILRKPSCALQPNLCSWCGPALFTFHYRPNIALLRCKVRGVPPRMDGLRYLQGWIGVIGITALGNTLSCFIDFSFLSVRVYTESPEQGRV